MATHSSVLAWRIPETGEPGGLLWGHTESDMTEVTQLSSMLACEMSAIVWQFEHSLALAFFEIGMKTDLSSPVATAGFSKLADIQSVAL